jgi:hypothetical protein
MATRKTSSSDMTARQPVAGKAKANVAGAAGHALATLIIAEATMVGELLEKSMTSRKDKLAKLIGLDGDGRKEFMADMTAKQAEINDDAKAVQGRSLRDYMEDYPKAGSIYAECSLWLRMAKAVDLGWKPTNDKGEALPQKAWPEWRLLGMQATKALDAKGKPSADGKNPELARSAARKRGRQATSPQSKAVNAVKNALKDDKGQALPKNNRNLAEVVRGILADATKQELIEVAAVVQTLIAQAEKAEKDAASALAKASASSTQGKDKLAENQTKTSNGATVTRNKATAEGVIPDTDKPTPGEKLVEEGKRIVASGSARRADARARAKA